jgi:hypothetical protein
MFTGYPSPRGSRRAVAAIAVIAVVQLGMYLGARTQGWARRRLMQALPPPELELISETVERDSRGAIVVRGEVENTGMRPVRGTLVICTFFDENGTVLETLVAPLSVSPLMPQAIGRFEIVFAAERAPLVKRYSITVQPGQ